jgi:glycolate oxidase iron-sulfur subunit
MVLVCWKPRKPARGFWRWKMMGIEEKNAREEIIEICEKCIKCGLCKELCPVFKVLREEQSSPRGHAILLSNKIYDKIVFDCTLCKACEEKCPLNLKICTAIRKARQTLNLKDKEQEKNKEMLKKLEEVKNPYL